MSLAYYIANELRRQLGFGEVIAEGGDICIVISEDEFRSKLADALSSSARTPIPIPLHDMISVEFKEKKMIIRIRVA